MFCFLPPAGEARRWRLARDESSETRSEAKGQEDENLLCTADVIPYKQLLTPYEQVNRSSVKHAPSPSHHKKGNNR